MRSSGSTGRDEGKGLRIVGAREVRPALQPGIRPIISYWHLSCFAAPLMSRPTVVYEPPALRHIHPVAALRRLRQFRDLFITLSLHRINVRYKQSRLGILWAVIQPLAMMVVFTLMFTLVRANPGGSVPFPLFAYAALVPWTMFSSGLSAASGALTSHASLLTKVAFPREILPLTYIVAALVDFVLSSAVLFGLMLWFSVTPSWTAVWALPAILLLVAFLIGLGSPSRGDAGALPRRRACDAAAPAGVVVRHSGAVYARRGQKRAS